MIAMAKQHEEWLTVEKAAQAAGCSVGWIRVLLARGDLEGWKSGQRAWNVSPDAVEQLRKTLTSRSVGKRDAKKPQPKPRKAR